MRVVLVVVYRENFLIALIQPASRTSGDEHFIPALLNFIVELLMDFRIFPTELLMEFLESISKIDSAAGVLVIVIVNTIINNTKRVYRI